MLETIRQFVENYGYWALLIGTFLEGETIVILGGIAAHAGYLEIGWVIACSFTGATFGDQLHFYIGRRWGNSLIGRWPTLKAKMDILQKKIERWHNWIILMFRFWYGLRNATPLALGMSNVKASVFATLNVIGAIIWAVTISMGGYLLGQAMETFIGDVKHYQATLLAGVAVLGLAVWLASLIIRKKKYGHQ